MKKIIGLILFSSLLVGCSDTSSTDTESSQSEQVSSESSESIEVSKDSFEFTFGVNANNISHADEENYVNIEGMSHEDKKIYVVYDGYVVDVIDIDDNGFFEYRSKSNEEITRLIFTDDSDLSMGDKNLKISDLENLKVVNVLPNEDYLAKQTEESSSEIESEPVESEAVEPESTESESSEPAEPVESSEPIESSEEETVASEVPREHESALDNAYSYLDYTSFSKSGLYDQLIYEGYPEDAAQYAIDNVNTDWNENALQTAINYLEYTSFSDQGLYDQLIYEGYTNEQAQYAMDNLP